MKGRTDKPQVTFELESRQLTAEPIAAGKRLFSRLIERAEKKINDDKRDTNV